MRRAGAYGGGVLSCGPFAASGPFPVMSRKTDWCSICEKAAAIAAHGLCFACYRRIQRQATTTGNGSGIQPEHKRLLTRYAAVMSGLADLGVSRDHVLAIKRILDLYLSSVAVYLNVSATEEAE